jgi:hypothetical protein
MKSVKTGLILVLALSIYQLAEAKSPELYVGDTATYQNTNFYASPSDTETYFLTSTLVSYNPVTRKYVEEEITNDIDGSIRSKRQNEIYLSQYLGTEEAANRVIADCANPRIYNGQLSQIDIQGRLVDACSYSAPAGPYNNAFSKIVGRVPFGYISYSEGFYSSKLVSFKFGNP